MRLEIKLGGDIRKAEVEGENLILDVPIDGELTIEEMEAVVCIINDALSGEWVEGRSLLESAVKKLRRML